MTWHSTELAPPPATAYFRIHSCATVAIIGSGAVMEADDGMGDPAVPSGTGPGFYLTSQTNSTPNTCKLIQMPGQQTITITKTLKAGITSGSRLNGWSIAFSVAQDNRCVTLTRPGATGDYVEYTSNPGVATKHGDTVFQYHYWVYDPYSGTYLDQPICNGQTVQSVLAGSWGTRSAWSWSPDDSGGSAIYDSPAIPFSNIEYWDCTPVGPSGGPEQLMINYTCTDSVDQATASAAYVLKAHDLAEPIASTVTNTKQVVNWRYDPNASWVVAPAPNGGDLTVGASSDYTWSVGGSVTGQVPQFAALGLGLSLSVSYEATVSANESVTINNVQPGWGSILDVGDLMDITAGTANTYTDLGSTGQTPFSITLPDPNPSAYSAAPLTYIGFPS